MRGQAKLALRGLSLLLAAVFVALVALPTRADEASAPGRVQIQDVTSPGGIHAWLVEEHSVPVISVEVSFDAGSRLDSAAKGGTAGFMAALLDEGAADLDSDAFKQALEDSAIRMGFSADLDSISGSFRALAPYTEKAFHLFSLAFTKPRFDAAAVERVRAQIVVALNEEDSDPNSIASKAWFATALKGHPYARPTYGTLASIKAITRDDLIANHKAHIGRDRLKIAVVGPIDAATLGRYLDTTFGALPKLGPVAKAAPLTVSGRADALIIERDIPQSVVTFGGPGIKAGQPDFIPAYVMNYILGGGGFASRLMDEIREKRGLTYGISTGLGSYEAGGLFIGGFSSRNEVYGTAYKLLVDEMNRMATGGVTDQELADAKTYLTGSFALRFDSNDKIAGQLLGYQELGYDIDYINKRNGLINAVTKEDVARVAQQLLKPDAMTFVVVGKPVTTAGPIPPPNTTPRPESSAPSENMSSH